MNLEADGPDELALRALLAGAPTPAIPEEVSRRVSQALARAQQERAEQQDVDRQQREDDEQGPMPGADGYGAPWASLSEADRDAGNWPGEFGPNAPTGSSRRHLGMSDLVEAGSCDEDDDESAGEY